MFLPLIFFFIDDLKSFVGLLPGGIELFASELLQNQIPDKNPVGGFLLGLSILLSFAYLVWSILYAKRRMDLRVRRAELNP